MAGYRIREHRFLRALAEGEHESIVALVVHLVEGRSVIMHQWYRTVGHLQLRIVEYHAELRRVHQAVPDEDRSFDQIDDFPDHRGSGGMGLPEIQGQGVSAARGNHQEEHRRDSDGPEVYRRGL